MPDRRIADCGHVAVEEAVTMEATAEDAQGKCLVRVTTTLCEACSVRILDAVLLAAERESPTGL